MPINFRLKSQMEQRAILYQYKNFLKNLNSRIQIIISSKKADISSHIEDVIRFTNENPQIKEMRDDYIQLIREKKHEKGSITKDFYIALNDEKNIDNNIIKIKEYLSNCGNEVFTCTKEEILDLIKNYTNKRVENLI